MDPSLLLVVTAEAVLALVATTLASFLRHRRPWVFFLFPLLGATWLALAHGLAFFSDGSDVGMLAGFGLVTALFFGLPIGVLAGGVAFVWWLAARPSPPVR